MFVEIDPSEMLASEEGTSSQNATAENPGNTGATETRFDAMKSVATADPQVELPEDWDSWAVDTSSEQSISQFAGGGDFGGFLVIPLPGGGAVHVEWPLSDWDYSRVYTEVPVDPFETGVE